MSRSRKPGIDVEQMLVELERVHGKSRRIPRFEPMDELVSCIMSQHTTDANSFPAFTRLRETFPLWQDLVDAGPEAVADVIRDAGLANAKSKNIVASLNQIHDLTGEFSLEVLRPMSTEDATQWLLKLPGVGPKTAAIVLCFAMGRGTIPVDTHVYRVSWRVGLVPEGIGEAKAQKVLEEVVPSPLSFQFHTTLIQHGRTICRAPNPICSDCPISSRCRWFQNASMRKTGSKPVTAKRTVKR